MMHIPPPSCRLPRLLSPATPAFAWTLAATAASLAFASPQPPTLPTVRSVLPLPLLPCCRGRFACPAATACPARHIPHREARS